MTDSPDDPLDMLFHNAAFRIMPTGVRMVMRHPAHRAGP